MLDLSKDGLSGAQTVAEFLAHGALGAGAVVIVDEAWQIGARQLFDLLKLIESRGARVVLSGDTRQHGPVEASDALRAIERYAGLHSAELNEIRRQDPERARDEAERTRIREYRAAVKEAAEGALESSFDRLEEFGAITEAAPELLRDELASAYVDLALNDESAIVVSQTWAEIDEVNSRIRRSLRERGLLVGAEEKVTSLRQVDLTTAQKNDQRYYPEDHVVVFNQSVHLMNCARLRLSAETTTIFVRDGWLVIEVTETEALRDQLDGANGDRLLTVAEVSDRTGFTAGAVRDWIKRSVLVAVRVGKEYRVREADLAKLLAGKTPETISISKRIGRRRKAVAV